MNTETERRTATQFDPDAHPYLLLQCLDQTIGHCRPRLATYLLHIFVATSTDEQLESAAHKATEHLLKEQLIAASDFDTVFGEMKTKLRAIRAREQKAAEPMLQKLFHERLSD